MTKYLATYLLQVLAGNNSPSVEEITATMASVGIEVDAVEVEKVHSMLDGKVSCFAAGRGMRRVGLV